MLLRIAWRLCRVSMLCMVMSGPVLAEDPPPAAVKSPLSPDESLKQFRLLPGLKIELVAAEPEVIDPVSIAFDETGTLWAIEMTDYPNGPQPGQPPMSRIRALQDKDGDGRYETSRVFADKLLFATGVQPWKGGVIVTLAGEIAWFKDTDGDGTADIRQTWFKGFAEQNPQLRANHPHWDLDNHVYVANGLRGGTVVADAQAWGRDLKPVTLSNFDFRFSPTTGAAEPISGVGQFGMTFDDSGHRFVCSNRNPCRQILLEDHYLKRNPLLAVKDVGSDAVPSGADSHVYPLSAAWTTSTQHAGQFTAACGLSIYRGSRLPDEYYGNVFTCEPTGNLVHREVLKPNGAQFTAVPNDAKVEFLASPDTWFRPVDLTNGPDGALYVVDMYRAVIEHPEWVPDELKHRPDERDGSDKGRIYRIVPLVQKPQSPPATFPTDISTKALVEKLESRDCWQAETAARLLVDRMDNQTGKLLSEVAISGSELGRLRAYRLLPTFVEDILDLSAKALMDPSPRVREQGLLLVEIRSIRDPVVDRSVRVRSHDPDPRVRFQAALTLGYYPDEPRATGALARILIQDANDEWARRAVLTSIGKAPVEFLKTWYRLAKFDDPITTGQSSAVQEIGDLIGAQQDQPSLIAALEIITGIPNERVQVAGILGLCQGIQRRGQSPQNALADAVMSEPRLNQGLANLYAKAVTKASASEADSSSRLQFLSVLQFASWDQVGNKLIELATSAPEQDLCVKAIDVLATFDDPSLTEKLLAQYAARTPQVRRAIVRALIRSPKRVGSLLQAIVDKQISLAELDPIQVKALMNHPDKEIKQHAQQILASAVPQDRKLVLEQFQKALQLAAKPERGRVVFEKNCATCHQIGKLGVNVGPDIADSRVKTPAQLLVDILTPNQAIDNNYVSYTVVTKDGRVETGFIANETAASITLKQPENKTQLILRQDIEELKSNGISLMPEGLEKNVSVEQMADLISFVKNWRYLDGQVPIKVSAP